MSDKIIYVDLEYPRLEGNPEEIEVGLTDVRAADSIRILYDFERDGWVIKQGSKFTFKVGEDIDEDWQEVAFIGAWAREQSGDGDS